MVPDVVLSGTIVRAEWTLEGLLARVGAGMHFQPVATVESFITVVCRTHVAQVLVMPPLTIVRPAPEPESFTANTAVISFLSRVLGIVAIQIRLGLVAVSAYVARMSSLFFSLVNHLDMGSDAGLLHPLGADVARLQRRPVNDALVTVQTVQIGTNSSAFLTAQLGVSFLCVMIQLFLKVEPTCSLTLFTFKLGLVFTLHMFDQLRLGPECRAALRTIAALQFFADFQN